MAGSVVNTANGSGSGVKIVLGKFVAGFTATLIFAEHFRRRLEMCRIAGPFLDCVKHRTKF